MKKTQRVAKQDQALRELRAFGLRYPETHTKSPWPGHMDLAVKDKTFAYLSVEGEPFKISCKLPQSCQEALALTFTKPTAYGLGKSGWVTAELSGKQSPPVDLLKEWIDESYRAQAPKRLVAQIPVGTNPTAAADRASLPTKQRKKATRSTTIVGKTAVKTAAKKASRRAR